MTRPTDVDTGDTPALSRQVQPPSRAGEEPTIQILPGVHVEAETHVPPLRFPPLQQPVTAAQGVRALYPAQWQQLAPLGLPDEYVALALVRHNGRWQMSPLFIGSLFCQLFMVFALFISSLTPAPLVLYHVLSAFLSLCHSAFLALFHTDSCFC